MLTSTHSYVDEAATFDNKTEFVPIFIALDRINLTIQIFTVHFNIIFTTEEIVLFLSLELLLWVDVVFGLLLLALSLLF